MMDSGSSKEFDAGTAGIDDAQVEWYNWNMNAFEAKCGEKPTRKPAKGGAVTSFAVGLWDQKVLEKLIERRPDAQLLYHLGNLHYDRRNYDTAARCWTEAAALDPDNAAVHRNLALYRYNKKKDSASALRSMEKAFALAGDDSRMLLELSQLYSACGKSAEERFALLSRNLSVTEERDDLYVEYLSLLADRGRYEEADALMAARRFHPWEGGEGKVTRLYKRIKCAIGDGKLAKGDYVGAEEAYRACLDFPRHLGEGKLILDTDNDVHYRLGELFRAKGEAEKAEAEFRLATRGKTQIEAGMFYNDMPVDYIFYAALSHAALGEIGAAERIADSFADYAAANKGKHVKIDYFAVSLPDLLVWELDLDRRNDEMCDCLLAMAKKIKRVTGGGK